MRHMDSLVAVHFTCIWKEISTFKESESQKKDKKCVSIWIVVS